MTMDAASRNILFLAHRVPFPPNRGDKIRAHHLLGKLAQLGRVHVGCFSESQEDWAASRELSEVAASHCVLHRRKSLALAGAEAVLSRKPVSLTAFYSGRLDRWVRKTIKAQRVDTIFVFSGQMGQYIPADFDGRVIVDLCDVDSAKFENYAAGGDRTWLNSREARLLAAEEERLAQRADATVLISEAEAALFQTRLRQPERTSIHVIGNGIDADVFSPDAAAPHPGVVVSEGPHFVFTGQMDYRPNEQAAIWAAETLLPAIRTIFTGAEMHIVGRNPTPTLLRHEAQEGLTIWGEVPDVRPFLAAADCVIAPLMIARGVQNKVLEAMAMGRPVLLTPEAATGIAAHDGREWMIAPTEAVAMCERVADLLRDPVQAETMGRSAREFVIAHHDWGAMLAPLESLVTGNASRFLRTVSNAA
ncbi:MAG: TIGR03087 family PEP-CTERM/XrtA system glycosyltransferase [Pseudomonadota bacterium]